MPFNGSGTYNAPSSPGAFNPALSGSSATPTAWNALLTDLTVSGLSMCITIDGQSTPTANIPMGNNKITALADGTALDDAATFGQLKGQIARIQKFTSTGTYTPHANMVWCIIQCIGPGGGGGASASNAGTTLVGGGGGSGSYSLKIASAATIGASQAVTISAGGAGGVSGGNPGASGAGDVSVGSLCIAKPGLGGAQSVHATSIAAGGIGGVAGTGDITLPGNDGGPGQNVNFSTGGFIAGSGFGAPSYLGGRVDTVIAVAAAVAGAAAAANSGAGGASAWCLNLSDAAGGAGGSGYVIITEYCWS